MVYIIGILVSLAAEGFKRYAKLDNFWVIITVLGLSFVGSVGYAMKEEVLVWPIFLLVFVVAGAFHNYVIRRFW